jgi:hypothetical protein
MTPESRISPLAAVAIGACLLAAAAGGVALVMAAPLGGALTSTREQAVARCWLLAGEAAPSWPRTAGPILDGLPECADLSAAEKTRLRAIAKGGLGVVTNGG